MGLGGGGGVVRDLFETCLEQLCALLAERAEPVLRALRDRPLAELEPLLVHVPPAHVPPAVLVALDALEGLEARLPRRLEGRPDDPRRLEPLAPLGGEGAPAAGRPLRVLPRAELEAAPGRHVIRGDVAAAVRVEGVLLEVSETLLPRVALGGKGGGVVNN